MNFNDIKKIYRYSKKFALENYANSLLIFLDCILAKKIHGFSNREFFMGGGVSYCSFRRSNYVTYRRALKIIDAFNNKNSIHYFENKVHFLIRFSDYIYRDWIYCKQSSFEEYVEFVNRNKYIIRKPLNSWQGQGVSMYKETKDLRIDYEQLRDNEVLLEEYIEQDTRMCFGNKSINTIRLFTVLDKAGKVHVVKSVLRAGVGNSVVDNFCAGGIVYSIDNNTGIVESKGMDGFGNRYIFHPQTNICMLGFQIPYWTEILSMIERAAMVVPEIRWVGWDVAISSKGPLLVEANHNPDQEFLEFIGDGFLYKNIMQYK